MSSSILKRILEGAASRPVDPNPPWGYEESEAVKILRLRVEQPPAPASVTLAEAAKKLAREEPGFRALAKSLGVTDEDLREVRDESPQELQRFIKIPVRPRVPPAERGELATIANPAACAAAVTQRAPFEEQLGPQTVHHIEHLERQVKMEQMRLKESRRELAEMSARFGEAAVEVALMEQRYEELDYSEIAEWVEEKVFPRLREVLGMPKVLTVLALFVVALPAPAGETRSREWSRESTDRESRESRESRETNEWSSDWSGPGAGHQIVPEPGSAAPLLAVAGAAMVLRRRRAAERRPA